MASPARAAEAQNVLFLEKYNRWHCREKHDAPQFTLKTGTIMEDSPIGLDKWLMAMWQIVNCKNGISSYEVHRAIGVTQKSAWFLDHRIRLALGMESFEKLSGHVEADETFIGGKAAICTAKRARRITGTGGKDKTAVMGILERGRRKHSTVRTTVVAEPQEESASGRSPQARRGRLRALHRCLQSYKGWMSFSIRWLTTPSQYVDGKIHTNGLENFWSLLEAGYQRNLCQCRAVPPVPVSG